MMSNKHRKILEQNFDKLSENLTADDMLNKLVAKWIITILELTRLRTYKVPSEKSTELLILLLVKPANTLYVLIDACEEYGMPHLAKLLTDAGS